MSKEAQEVVEESSAISFRITTINVLFQGYYEKYAAPDVQTIPEAQCFAWARNYLIRQTAVTDVFVFQEWSASVAKHLTGHLNSLGFSVSAPATDQIASVVGCAIAFKDSVFALSCPAEAFLFEDPEPGEEISANQLVVAGLRHHGAPETEVIIGSVHLPYASSSSIRSATLRKLVGPLFPEGWCVAAILAGDFNAMWDGSGILKHCQPAANCGAEQRHSTVAPRHHVYRSRVLQRRGGVFTRKRVSVTKETDHAQESGVEANWRVVQ